MGNLYKEKFVSVFFNIELDRRLTLSFNKHYLNISKKSSPILGFIFISRKCKDFTNLFTLKTLYFSLARSILEYNSIVWLPSKNIYSDVLKLSKRDNHFY